MRLRTSRGDDDRGATLVEFALIAPLFFLLLGSMVDIGLAVLGRSVASNAAREGARVGIIDFENADIQSSAAYMAVKTAAESKLVGLVKPNTSSPPYVNVRCLNGAAPHAAIPCTRAQVRIDFDLIEVEVRWRSVAPAGGVFTPDTYVDRARMVITGGVGGGGGCVGSGGNVNISPPSTTIDEGNGPGSLTVSLTVSRANSTCTTTVNYATADGTAIAPGDYTAVTGNLVFSPGETSKTIDVEIIGDSVTEPDESFTVNLSSIANGTPGSLTSAVTIRNDDVSSVPPALTFLRMHDMNADGTIDRVSATFDKDLQATCATPNAFTFPTKPTGLSLNSVTFQGPREVWLNLNPGAIDTSPTALTVALAAGCLRDPDGNSATFPEQGPLDRAAPVLLSVTDTDGTADGVAAPGDQLILTFSEPIAPSSIPATTNVVMTGGATGTLTVPGIILPTNLNPKNKKDYSDCTLTFNGSAVSANASQRSVTVTLGALSPGCTATAGESSNSANGGIVFVPADALNDGADIPNKAVATNPAFRALGIKLF